MNSVMRNLGLSALAVAVLTSCAATSTETATPATTPQAYQVPLAQPPQVSQPLTPVSYTHLRAHET